MKILVVSLLRVGDLIQQKPLLEALRRAHPGAEIHVLANKGSLSVRSIFPDVDGWFSFDREKYQSLLGSAEQSLFRPVQELENLIAELSAENYDLLLNFTHNRLSAHLCAAIPAGRKLGLLAEGRGFRSFENPWLRHFNERFGAKDGTPFHYVELLARAFELGEIRPPKLAAHGKTIFLQPLTSDPKKNYHASAWRELIRLFRNEDPSREIRLLGAPFEEESLRKNFDGEELAILDWSGLKRAFGDAALLITGDTSVKHLAAQEGVPVLELALGSADPAKTGVYAEGAWILHAAVACAPCSHSRPCRKLSHECGESLSARTVFETASAILAGQKPVIPVAPVRLLETRYTHGLGWGFDSSLTLEKAVWSLSFQEGLLAIGSRARDWKMGMASFQEEVPDQELHRSQAELERHFALQVKALQELSSLCFAENLNPRRVEELRRELSGLHPLHPVTRDYFWEVRDVLAQPFPSAMHFFGALKKKFESVGRRIEIRKKVIQQITEDSNGSISGKEADRRPEAP